MPAVQHLKIQTNVKHIWQC